MLSVYNKINDYIIVLNFMGEIIFCNESFLKRLSYNNDEILKEKILKIIKNKEINIGETLTQGKDINKTLDFYSKSGEIIQVDSNISIEYFNYEKSIFIIGKEVKSKPYTMEMLEDILDNSHITAFIVDKEGRYLYANKAFENTLNLPRKDIIGTYNSNHWNHETYRELDKNNKEVYENKRPKIFNEKLILGDKIAWFNSFKCPIYDENNEFKYTIGTSENINLSKKISEELYRNYNIATNESDYNGIKNNNADLKTILTNIGGHIIDYTKSDGLSILLYDKYRKGLTPFIQLKNDKYHFNNLQFIPCQINDVYAIENKFYFNNLLHKSTLCNIETSKQMNIKNVSYSGNYIIELSDEFIGIITLSYCGSSSPKFNYDEYMKYICNKIAMIIKNIRLYNQVSLENKMRESSEKELEQYLNVSVDLVSVVGRDTYFKRVSPNWYNVLGWSEEELLSRPITDIIHPEDMLRINKLKASKNPTTEITRTHIRFRHKDGRYVHLEWNSKYIPSQEAYITSATDITIKLEAEKEKRELEETVQLEIVKNEFFSNISHEFRTPINILLGTMQLINKNIEENSIEIKDLKKYANYIKQNSYRLLRLVNNLIDISKMDIGAYELRSSNQNIISIIEDITLSVADYTQNNKINLVFDTNVEELITCCDPDKIERIMLNLLSNAIKFTPENGTIEVNIDACENSVKVSVKDSGVGIPKDKLEVIFDRFGQVDGSFNRKCEGSGIGLSLVKNLVEMHGGTINVTSNIDEGSEFIFSIPIRFKEEDNKYDYDRDRKSKHVERCDIEFSDIYNVQL